jgi:hypothetical protein
MRYRSRGFVLALISFVSLGSVSVGAQDIDCTKTPCASGKCTKQCFAGNCSSYCALKQIGVEISSPAGLDIHIDNVTPDVAAKVRSLLENAQ